MVPPRGPRFESGQGQTFWILWKILFWLSFLNSPLKVIYILKFLALPKKFLWSDLLDRRVIRVNFREMAFSIWSYELVFVVSWLFQNRDPSNIHCILKICSILENGSSNHSGSDVSSPLTSPQELSDPNSRAVTIRVNPGGTGLDSLNRRPNNLSLSRKSSSSKEPLYATIGSKRSTLPSASARLADVWRISRTPAADRWKENQYSKCVMWKLGHCAILLLRTLAFFAIITRIIDNYLLVHKNISSSNNIDI